MNYGFRPLTNMEARIALCSNASLQSAREKFVRLMDDFFGVGAGRDPLDRKIAQNDWTATLPPNRGAMTGNE